MYRIVIQYGRSIWERSERAFIMRSLFTDELITSVKITELLSSIESSDWRGQEVKLCMPGFKIECTFDKMEESLKELGVRRAFSASQAQFGNLSLEVSFD